MRNIFRYSLLFILGTVLFTLCTEEKPLTNEEEEEEEESPPSQTLTPNIRGVIPSTAAAGEMITITGVNFGENQSSIKVNFDEISAEINSISDSKIEAIVPPRGDNESVKIQVTVSDKKSNQFMFRYDYPVPVIESLLPEAGKAGSTIEINGTGFSEIMKDVTVTFDGKTVSPITVSETLIKIKVPDYAGKRTVNVQVKVKQKLSNEFPFSYTEVLYSNPVSILSLPDPTLVKANDGTFYLYATEDIRNMPIMKSKNLVDWEQAGTAFTNATRPTFEAGGGLWAPNINHINGKYVLYYSMSVWGGEWTCGIGIATSDSPAGPFSDRGKLFRSNEIGVQNSIDPDLFEDDDGKKYLFWGSWRGIYMLEMSDDGLSIKKGATKQQVAGTYFEAVAIHKREGYYYMFASIGSCCNGLNSTYQLVVGRSINIEGPYLNKSGRPMMSNNYTLLINKNDSFLGNGHCSQIVTDDDGNDWILYHGIRTSNASGRVLMLDRVYWDNGWPRIADGTPTKTGPAPVFN